MSSLFLLECTKTDPSGSVYDILDGEGFLWCFHAPVVYEFSLCAEREYPFTDIAHAAVAESLLAARLSLKALIYQARQSSGTYAQRLLDKGHGAEDAALAILIAEIKGDINDFAYASYLLSLRYERRREGAAALRHWLLRKGFTRSLADAVLSVHRETADPLADALALLRKRFKPDDKRERAWAFLAGRGYDAETAQRALRRFFGAGNDWDTSNGRDKSDGWDKSDDLE